MISTVELCTFLVHTIWNCVHRQMVDVEIHFFGPLCMVLCFCLMSSESMGYPSKIAGIHFFRLINSHCSFQVPFSDAQVALGKVAFNGPIFNEADGKKKTPPPLSSPCQLQVFNDYAFALIHSSGSRFPFRKVVSRSLHNAQHGHRMVLFYAVHIWKNSRQDYVHDSDTLQTFC